MGLSIKVPKAIEDLLSGFDFENLRASLHSNLVYILPLEGLTKEGQPRTPHSPQAPDGMVRKNLAVIETVFVESVNAALGQILNGANPREALDAALTNTINFALTTIVADTPVDTGRAMLSWEITNSENQTSSPVSGGLQPSKWDDKAFVNAHLKTKRAIARDAKLRNEGK